MWFVGIFRQCTFIYISFESIYYYALRVGNLLKEGIYSHADGAMIVIPTSHIPAGHIFMRCRRQFD